MVSLFFFLFFVHLQVAHCTVHVIANTFWYLCLWDISQLYHLLSRCTIDCEIITSFFCIRIVCAFNFSLHRHVAKSNAPVEKKSASLIFTTLSNQRKFINGERVPIYSTCHLFPQPQGASALGLQCNKCHTFLVPVIQQLHILVLYTVHAFPYRKILSAKLADHSATPPGLRLTPDGYLTGDFTLDMPPMKCVLIDPYTG